MAFFRGLIFLFLLNLGCAAAETAKPICPAAPIRIGFFEFGVLFTAERGSQNGFGLDRDFAFELEKRSGCHFVGELMSRARIWVELQEGRLDMTLSALKTPEREAMGWMIPYSVGSQVVLLFPGVPKNAQDQAGFMANPALKFGVVRGFRHLPYYDALIDRLRTEGRVVEAVDEAQLISMVRRGSVDAIAAVPTVVARYISAKEFGRDVIQMQWNTKDEPLVAHVLLSRKTFSASEAEKWQSLVDDMRRDGTLLAIIQRYFDKKTARELVYQPKEFLISRPANAEGAPVPAAHKDRH